MSLRNQVSKAIRILSWDRDVSARASHLVDYYVIQAEFENVSKSTTERKTMSSKTSFKRIALVAVAALAFGGISAVSSQAAGFSDSLTLTNATSTTVAGTAVTDTLTASFIGGARYDTFTATVSIISVPALSTTGGTLADLSRTAFAATSDSGTVSGKVLTVTNSLSSAGRSTGSAVISFTPDVAGTYVLKVTPVLGNATAASTALTWTVTANAVTYNHSVAVISTSDLSTDTANTTEDASSTALTAAASATAATPVAKISLSQWQSTTAGDTKTALGASNGLSMLFTVSGAGSLGSTHDASTRSTSVSVDAATADSAVAFLFPNGASGIATVTASVGGVVVATKTFSFYGVVAGYKLGTSSKTYTGVGETSTNRVYGLDALGVTQKPGTFYAFSSDTTVATVAVNAAAGTDYETVTVTGVKTGTATITIGNKSTLATSTFTKSYDVSVTKTDVANATVKFDQDSYAPGATITIYVTATNVDGKPTADGTRTIFAASSGLVSNVSLTAATFGVDTLTVALKGGVGSFTATAPSYGSVNVQGTLGNLAATAINETATVINAAVDAANAAIDAAQEATDAANAAYDAANNAMDSADAATAAAQDASDNASAALAAVTSLSATVAKLVKSVAAIAAALAKVQKKIGA